MALLSMAGMIVALGAALSRQRVTLTTEATGVTEETQKPSRPAGCGDLDIDQGG